MYVFDGSSCVVKGVLPRVWPFCVVTRAPSGSESMETVSAPPANNVAQPVDHTPMTAIITTRANLRIATSSRCNAAFGAAAVPALREDRLSAYFWMDVVPAGTKAARLAEQYARRSSCASALLHAPWPELHRYHTEFCSANA